jgi:16S rRNA (guanine966-N2)-methyltransferase
MRVIAGKYRSRKLRTLHGLALRPTSDKLRETLFNVLGPAVDDSVFIDIFAGTGAVGIEALSRGASEVYFVEKHPPAARLIRENLESLGIVVGARPVSGPRVEIFASDAIRALETLEKRHLVADFVFLDPPYKPIERYVEVLDFLARPCLLAPGALVIAEHASRDTDNLPDDLNALERFRTKAYGDSALSFYNVARAA